MRLLCLLALVSPLLARAEPPPLSVPQVVVHGRRHVQDEAAPTTVIDRRTIEEDAVADLPELLDEQPGMRTTRLGGLGSFSALSVRGSNTDQVLVLLDGIPLNSAEGGPVDLSTIPLGPVDTVVIYRGLAPLAAGSSAIGGVVSIHTRALQESQLELQAGGGSFGTRTARAFYGTGRSRWGLGVAVDYLGSQGDFSYTDDRGTLLSGSTADDVERERANNQFDQVAALAKGWVALGSQTRLRLLNLLTWRQRDIPGLGIHPNEEASLGALRNLFGVKLEADRFGEQRVELAVAPYLSWSRTELHDPAAELGVGADETSDESLVPGVAATLRVPLVLDDEAEFVLTPAVSAAYRYERFEPGGMTLGPAPSSERHLVSAATELSALLGPADLELVASVRYEESRSQRGTEESGPTPAFTWRAAIVQSSIPFTQLKANVSSGVRFPSLFELFGNTGLVRGNPSLTSESGLNMDFGVVHAADWLPARDTWTFEAFAFWSRTDDLIQFVQNAQGVAIASNVDSALVAGVELGTFADLLGHLRVRGSFAWMHTEDTSEIRASQHKRLPHRPEWKAFGRVEGYWRPGGVVAEVGLGLEAEYMAGNFLDSANLVEVPERLLLGASAWATLLDGQLRIDLTVRNLTSDRVQDLAGFPLPPINVMATARYAPELPE